MPSLSKLFISTVFIIATSTQLTGCFTAAVGGAAAGVQ